MSSFQIAALPFSKGSSPHPFEGTSRAAKVQICKILLVFSPCIYALRCTRLLYRHQSGRSYPSDHNSLIPNANQSAPVSSSESFAFRLFAAARSPTEGCLSHVSAPNREAFRAHTGEPGEIKAQSWRSILSKSTSSLHPSF
jgi:hypothetical protein